MLFVGKHEEYATILGVNQESCLIFDTNKMAVVKYKDIHVLGAIVHHAILTCG